MKTIKLSVFLLIFIVSTYGCALEKIPDQSIHDLMVPVDLPDVKVSGEIGRRIDITVKNNLLALQLDEDFLATFMSRDEKYAPYVGIGKLMDALVKFAAYTGDEEVISLKEYVINKIIEVQEADGYPGNMLPENRMWQAWDICEMGYIIYGLINDYRYFGNEPSLLAARNVADYIIDHWSSLPENWESITSIAEHVIVTGLDRSMLTLYGITGDKRYLEFEINQRDLANWDPGIVIGRRLLIEGHIYAYMASCLAQLEYYRLQPEEKLLHPTMTAIDFLSSKDGMVITGGAGQVEIWTDDQDGGEDLGESCATAYQIRVYENLLRLGEDSRYGDLMERTIYNALFGAQSPDGRHIRYYTTMEGPRAYFEADTYCCPNNFRRIISELPGMIYYSTGNGVAINLYSSSSANLTLDGGLTVKMEQETDYPNSGHVAVRINPTQPSSFPLKLRIPLWCREAGISVNGEPLNIDCSAGTFAVIHREWNPGDRVELDLSMEWRLIEGRKRQAGRVAVMRGPMVYCLNPEQDESLAQLDGDALGRIVIDLASIEQKVEKNSDVRPNGTACRVSADNILYSMGNSGVIKLTLTEFADPGGSCTYFKVPDLSEAVPDELTDLWK